LIARKAAARALVGHGQDRGRPLIGLNTKPLQAANTCHDTMRPMPREK